MPTTGKLCCCARDASGHEAAAPLRSVMNSRRLITAPEGLDKGIVPANQCAGRGVTMTPANVRFGVDCVAKLF